MTRRHRADQIAEFGDLPGKIAPHVLRQSLRLAGDLGYSGPLLHPERHRGHSITSRYVHAADAVLPAAVDAVANKTLKLMAQPDLRSDSDQEQPQLLSACSDTGSAMWDGMTSL